MSNSPIIRSSSTLPGVSQGQTLRWDTVTAKWEPSSSLVIKDNGAIAANGTIAINDDLANSISILGVTGITMNSVSFNPAGDTVTFGGPIVGSSFNPGGETVTFGGPVVGSSFNVTGVRSTGADEVVANALLRRDTIEGIVDAATYWDPATGGINYPAGNVGIGQSNPQATIDLTPITGDTGIKLASRSNAGSFYIGCPPNTFSDTSNGNYIRIEQAGDNGGNMYFRTQGTGGQGQFEWLGLNGVSRMRIDAAGKVGIGTTSPQSELEVAGDIEANNMAWAHCNSAGTVLGSANIASVTKQGTGSYYVNFSHASPSTNAQCGVASIVSIFGFVAMCTPLSTTRIQVTITNTAGSYADVAFMIWRTY
jgi:hypothetical protein